MSYTPFQKCHFQKCHRNVIGMLGRAIPALLIILFALSSAFAQAPRGIPGNWRAAVLN